MTKENSKITKSTARKIVIKIFKEYLPETIHAFTSQRDNATYWIFLNANESDEEQVASFIHECTHIYHEDFDSDLNADEIEAIRHNEVKQVLEILSNRQ